MNEISVKRLAERDTKNLLCRVALKLWHWQKLPLHEIEKRLAEIENEQKL